MQTTHTGIRLARGRGSTVALLLTVVTVDEYISICLGRDLLSLWRTRPVTTILAIRCDKYLIMSRLVLLYLSFLSGLNLSRHLVSPDVLVTLLHMADLINSHVQRHDRTRAFALCTMYGIYSREGLRVFVDRTYQLKPAYTSYANICLMTPPQRLNAPSRYWVDHSL